MHSLHKRQFYNASTKDTRKALKRVVRVIDSFDPLRLHTMDKKIKRSLSYRSGSKEDGMYAYLPYRVFKGCPNRRCTSKIEWRMIVNFDMEERATDVISDWELCNHVGMVPYKDFMAKKRM